MAAEAPWTIEELGRRVHRVFANHPNEKVREPLTERTIRFYATLGLLARPLAMRGRKALYGRQHLLQLVAIRRLQAEAGLSLDQIQECLVGAAPAQLEATARLAPDVPTGAGLHEPSAVDEPSAEYRRSTRQSEFWKRAPMVSPAAPVARLQASAARLVSTRQDLASLDPALVQGIRLPHGVTVAIPAVRLLTSADLHALRDAAASLLEVAATRGLLPSSPER